VYIIDLLQKSEKLNDDSKSSTLGACNRNPEVELQESKYPEIELQDSKYPEVELQDSKYTFARGLIK
jgi:hypothetical protein